MKKTYFSFIFLLITLILAACMQQESNIYEGESEHWKGRYEAFSIDGKMYKFKLIIQYKTEIKELSNTEKIKFNFGNSFQIGTETMEYAVGDDPKKGEYENIWNHTGVGTGFSEETISTVTIEWDGIEEKIELQKH